MITIIFVVLGIVTYFLLGTLICCFIIGDDLFIDPIWKTIINILYIFTCYVPICIFYIITNLIYYCYEHIRDYRRSVKK